MNRKIIPGNLLIVPRNREIVPGKVEIVRGNREIVPGNWEIMPGNWEPNLRHALCTLSKSTATHGKLSLYIQGRRPIFERFSKWSVALTGWNKNLILGLRLAYGHM